MGKGKKKVAIQRLSPKALRAVAFHEAGHVAARAFTKLEMGHIRQVSIVANARTWGHERSERALTLFTLHIQPKDLAWRDGRMLLLGLLAGSAAGEKIDSRWEYLPRDWGELLVAIKVENNSGESDFTYAFRVCETLVRPGVPARTIYGRAVKWTREMIEIPAVWAFVESLAGRLLKEKTISGDDPRLIDAMMALPPVWGYPKWERRLDLKKTN